MKLSDLFTFGNHMPRMKQMSTATGKHAASKKGYQHKHNLSKGQLNHQKFVKNGEK